MSEQQIRQQARLAELIAWLEDDGYAECAGKLAHGAPETLRDKARDIAGHCEAHPVYGDERACALAAALRSWADAQAS